MVENLISTRVIAIQCQHCGQTNFVKRANPYPADAQPERCEKCQKELIPAQ
ncbi:MAG: hypothetical protein Q8Q33_06885 [Chlamydiota bacterium]|nr:hypothetical protein [Chlamydiota bacterium]